MFYLDLTLPTPAENLALDEALLAEAEAGGPEVLRVWESPTFFVVLGLGGRRDDDVHDEACAADGVPVLRRSSGGGTVLQGPGCLSYALVLRTDRDPALSSITGTNAYVLDRMATALRSALPDIHYRGISDLALGARKISGNAQRRKKHWTLFHGTLLYDFPSAAITRYLKQPKRQPDYREDRPHEAFLTNAPLAPEALIETLRRAWGAEAVLPRWPETRMQPLLADVQSRSRPAT